MRIAFLGLGAMGQPMASLLLKAGHDLSVWNRSREPVDTLVKAGARALTAPEDAANADVVISMLADDAATHAVIVESGLLAALPAGAIHINMATISVALATSLAAAHQARGVGYVAAPVLGRIDVAAAGKLNILAAGANDLIARIQPLFDCLGQKTWRFGDQPQQANAVKLAANFNIACAIESMAESAALVDAHGVAPRDFIEMLTSTLFASPVHINYGGMIVKQSFAPAGFKLRLGLKDVRLALEASNNANLPMPFGSVLRDNFLDAVAQGDGDLDWTALSTVAFRRGGRAG